MESFAAFLDATEYWYWLALGLLLMVVEVIAPGVLFLWLGVAAIVTGLALLAIPSMSWEIQFVVFAVLSVVSIFVGRRLVSTHQEVTDHPTLNRRGENFIGRHYTLAEATAGGQGRLKIEDSMWAISVRPEGSDLAAGVRVVVIGVDGATLVVETSPASVAQG